MIRRVGVGVTVVMVVALVVTGVVQYQDWKGATEQRRSISSASGPDAGLTLFAPGERPAAPDLQGRTLDGETYQLRAQRGRVVVLNVWGSWCGPCRAETPELVRIANAYEKEAVRFVGVDTRDSLTAARAFVRRFNVPYPSVIDEGDLALVLRDVVPTAVVPSTIVIDREGRVAARVIGRITGQTLRGILDDELGASKDKGGDGVG